MRPRLGSRRCERARDRPKAHLSRPSVVQRQEMQLLPSTDGYPTFIDGGHRETDLLARYIVARGNEVTVVTPWHGGLPTWEDRDGMRCSPRTPAAHGGGGADLAGGDPPRRVDGVPSQRCVDPPAHPAAPLGARLRPVVHDADPAAAAIPRLSRTSSNGFRRSRSFSSSGVWPAEGAGAPVRGLPQARLASARAHGRLQSRGIA